jgi:hypothetical protein
LTIRFEQVHPLPLAQATGHWALLEFHGNDVGSTFRLLVCTVQREPDLLLNVSSLTDRTVRKKNQDNMRRANGIPDGRIPFLTRQDVHGVEPRNHFRVAQLIVYPASSLLVFGSVT